MNSDYLSTPISWGTETIDNFIPKYVEKQVTVIKSPVFSKKKQYEGTTEEALEKAFQNPLGYNQSFDSIVRDVFQRGKPIVITVDDSTRPNIHTKRIIPILVKKLLSLGLRKEDIKILIATGTHRISRKEEYSNIIGEKMADLLKDNIVSHDCDNSEMIEYGKSTVGTPILLNKWVQSCSMLIPLTDSELHYFAGMAGTIKHICPGLASRKTVKINHTQMFHREFGFVPECKLGNVENNPVIQDIKNIVEIVKEQVHIFGIDAIVTDGEIVYLNAGDIVKLHEEAVEQIINMRTVKVPRPADLIITGLKNWGINLYQTGKGICAASYGVKEDGEGQIIVLSPCPEQIGNKNYEKIMDECKDMSTQKALDYVLDNYCSEKTFDIGNQNPVEILRVLKKIGDGNIMMISDMDSQKLIINRIVPIKEASESPIKALRREVKRVLENNSEATIFVLDDPGLLIKVNSL